MSSIAVLYLPSWSLAPTFSAQVPCLLLFRFKLSIYPSNVFLGITTKPTHTICSASPFLRPLVKAFLFFKLLLSKSLLSIPLLFSIFQLGIKDPFFAIIHLINVCVHCDIYYLLSLVTCFSSFHSTFH